MVQKKIRAEEVNMREMYPIKLFEILEEKLSKKQISAVNFLSQTKYFKKVLDITCKTRDSQRKTGISQL